VTAIPTGSPILGITVKAKDLVEAYPALKLSACDTWTIATIEANHPLLLSVIPALPYPSRAHHQPQCLGLGSGGQFLNIFRP